jgi:hypothetical protein
MEGNIEGNVEVNNIQGTWRGTIFREHRGEHSRNIQGIFKEHAWNIEGTLREH